MKKLIRFLLWFIGALVVLSILLGIALQIFIDPNDYRDDISLAVEDATGRQLIIEGELSLQTFPCCGLQLGPLQLNNPPGFAEGHFARVENAAVSVRLLPLILSQEIAIGDVELDGLYIVLTANQIVGLPDRQQPAGRAGQRLAQPVGVVAQVRNAVEVLA